MKSEKGALEFKEKGLEESNTLINPDMKVTELGDGYTLVGCGYSNRTPWNSPRECGEEELKTKLDRLMSQVSDPSRCILAAHVPPYESGLDDAPKLKDMQVQSRDREYSLCESRQRLRRRSAPRVHSHRIERKG